MGSLGQDVKFGLRMLGKNPGFTLVAVLTLALGIGANTAMFSIVRAVLLEPLPYAESDRLAIAARNKPGVLRTIASYPEFTDWHQSGVFEKSAATVGRGFFFDRSEGPLPLAGRRVSEGFFDALGVRPVLGRAFLPDESKQGDSSAVISHSLWKEQLGGDPNIIGKTLPLRGQVAQVVGVLPPDFADPISPLSPRDVYVPLVVSPEERTSRNSQWLQVVGRLREGVTLEQAGAQVEAISLRTLKENQGSDVRTLAPFTLISLREHQVGDAETALWLLLGAVGFVLLIGCVNVSNLLMVRLTARRHELAVRAAIGASAPRLAAQLMTESLLLSLAGGGIALVFVLWTIDLIKAVSPVNIPRLAQAGVDLQVFGFALAVTVLAGMLFGLLPVFRGARQDVAAALKQTSGTAAGHQRSRSVLLVAEVALTMVLLVGAALALASFGKLLRVDPGFQTGDVLTVNLTYAGQWRHEQQWPFFAALMERVRALPGVRAAGTVDNLPFSGAWSQFTTKANHLTADPRPELAGQTFEYQQGVIGGDYFRVMNIPLKAGRLFDARDAAPDAKSVIVSESFARALWGERTAIGRRVSDGQTLNAEVVGVVGDVRHFGPDAPAAQTLYRPMAQREAWGGTLVILADRDASTLLPALRENIRALDDSVVIQRSRTMDEWLGLRTASPRFLAVLLGSFGAVALGLAAVGIYGVVGYSVGQRTREIGVRMALGAQPGSVLWMVVRGGAKLAAAGIALGLGGAYALSRVLRAQLFEVSPTDPAMYAFAGLVVIGMTLAACYMPARRAAKVDPMVALRYE